MRYILLAVLLAMASPAGAQFLGGMAEGIEDARRSQRELRALEYDRMYGTSTYRILSEQHRAERVEQQLRENAEMLRRLDQERFNRLYGPHPRY